MKTDFMQTVRAIKKMRAAGFALSLDDGKLAVEPGARLSDKQRAWLRAHTDDLVALLNDAETLYKALQGAGDAGLASGDGADPEWIGERMEAAGEILYNGGRMMSVHGRRYLRERAPVFARVEDVHDPESPDPPLRPPLPRRVKISGLLPIMAARTQSEFDAALAELNGHSGDGG